MLCELYSARDVIEIKTKDDDADTINISEITVPDDGNEYEIRVFWLDSMVGKNPLHKQTVFVNN